MRYLNSKMTVSTVLIVLPVLTVLDLLTELIVLTYFMVVIVFIYDLKSISYSVTKNDHLCY